MQTMHAIAAGLGAPVRLRPFIDPFSDSGTPPLTQEKATGAMHGTTAAQNVGHLYFAGFVTFAPVAGKVRHE